MLYKERVIASVEDQDVLLRNARAEDAENLLHYLKATAEETRFLSREPNETEDMTIEQETEFIRSRNESSTDMFLVAERGNELVGTCSFMGKGNFRRYAHRCDIGIALYQKYWGQGIGTAMLTEILSAAKQAGYEQAELEVVSDNWSAIQLYEKIGFQKYGTFPHNMKYADESYADAEWMLKWL